MLQQTGAIAAMAKDLGIDEKTASTAASALLPAIVAGMGRSATSTGAAGDPLGGLGGLAGAILGGGGAGGGLGGGLLEAVLGNQPTPTQPGNDILGTIFGSKDVSRSVAGEVAAMTGISEDLLKQMLPILAMAVAGYLAKQATGGGTAAPAVGGSTGGRMLGGILGSIVTGMMKR
jgi:hypothetical protein